MMKYRMNKWQNFHLWVNLNWKKSLAELIQDSFYTCFYKCFLNIKIQEKQTLRDTLSHYSCALAQNSQRLKLKKHKGLHTMPFKEKKKKSAKIFSKKSSKWSCLKIFFFSFLEGHCVQAFVWKLVFATG